MGDFVLNVLTLLDFMSAVSVGDIANVTQYQNDLIRDIFDPKRVNGMPTGYNCDLPGQKPTTVETNIVLDHIEDLDDQQQTMTVHGTFIFRYWDSRVKWNTTEYGGLMNVTSLRSSMMERDREPFVPKIIVARISLNNGDITREKSAQYKFDYRGKIQVRVKFSLRTACEFNFDDYPYDRQNCTFVLLNDSTMDYIVMSDRGMKTMTRRGRRSSHDVGDYTIRAIGTQSIQFRPGGNISAFKDFSKLDLPNTRSMLRVTFYYQREDAYFMFRMAIPNFCISTSTLVVALIPSYFGLSLLLMMTCVQIMHGMILLENLPPDYTSTPTIALIALFILFETTVLIIYRSTYLVVLSKPTIQKQYKQSICYTEIIIRLICLFSIFYHYYRLFHNPLATYRK